MRFIWNLHDDGDRFEGHIVQGHVDCLGTIKSIKQNGNSTDFFILITK